MTGRVGRLRWEGPWKQLIGHWIVLKVHVLLVNLKKTARYVGKKISGHALVILAKCRNRKIKEGLSMNEGNMEPSLPDNLGVNDLMQSTSSGLLFIPVYATAATPFTKAIVTSSRYAIG